ncbi:MAG: glycosyltransferase family 2 protein, partial [Cognatishimia sp.]|nr:glycosyltransferase family 2 protein [Cognatishimia sp.]
MGLWSTYKLRLRRKRYLLRARRKARQLTSVQDHTAQIKPGDTLLVCTLYNEAIRMPYFLRYYRDLGIDHFLIIDNDSDDGVMDHLEGQPD